MAAAGRETDVLQDHGREPGATVTLSTADNRPQIEARSQATGSPAGQRFAGAGDHACRHNNAPAAVSDGRVQEVDSHEDQIAEPREEGHTSNLHVRAAAGRGA